MRTLLIVASTLLLGAQQAPMLVPTPKPAAEAPKPVTPKPITDAEARKVRELQLAISEAQNALFQLERTFKTKQAEFQAAAGELDKYIDALQNKYKCPDFDLDQQLTWKKKPVPQPGTNQP
jgi:hypothetical protein